MQEVVPDAISRIDVEVHWPTDVPAAILIAVSVRWISEGTLGADSK